METILVLTDNREQFNEQLGPTFQQIYARFTLKVRQIDASLLTDLLSGLPPLMILVDSCVDSLPFLKEIKAHPVLRRVPVLMLRAIATRQKTSIELGTEKKYTSLFRQAGNPDLTLGIELPDQFN
jgi:hypothetical protein